MDLVSDQFVIGREIHIAIYDTKSPTFPILRSSRGRKNRELMPTTAKVIVKDIELDSENLDIARAAAIYREHGCLVVRGLSRRYAATVRADIEAAAQQAISLLDHAKKSEEHRAWFTPDGTLFVQAPKGFHRDKQIWGLACNYRMSAAFLYSAFDPRTVDIIEAILGPDIELHGDGQCLYKEPVGGTPKPLHQDGAYHEHKYEGPVAVLNYAVDTDLNNGALHVVPGSHRLGLIEHGGDRTGHLGLDEREWPWERALPVCGHAGDAIFFANNTIHGSKENDSTAARPVFVNRYRRADDYVIAGGTTPENRAKRIATATKENQLGLMVRGRRAFQSERS
jgi:phytanoyl-CoA hydroxylase